jgi:hypothetical protein
MGDTRELVEKYIKIMFHGTEEDLNRFCVKHKIEFLVHDSSYNYAAPMHIYCNRYMAAAKDIKTDSPAWIMSRKPDSCKWFYYIHPPDKLIPLSTMYKVFKVIRPDERIKAMKYAVKGISLLKRGYKSRAKKLAREALSLDPAYPPARVLYSLAFDRPFELQLNDFTRKSGEKQQL